MIEFKFEPETSFDPLSLTKSELVLETSFDRVPLSEPKLEPEAAFDLVPLTEFKFEPDTTLDLMSLLSELVTLLFNKSSLNRSFMLVSPEEYDPFQVFFFVRMSSTKWEFVAVHNRSHDQRSIQPLHSKCFVMSYFKTHGQIYFPIKEE